MPIGTPVKSDLSPYDITKENFNLLSKQSVATIWLPEHNNNFTNYNGNNNNIVFSFLPKNLLEL